MPPATAPLLRFTAAELDHAYEEWGANCGPAALAACLGWHIADARPACLGFETRRYMNAGQMREAIENAEFRIEPRKDRDWTIHGVARIQFGGPWTGMGGNPRWASTHTHWVTAKQIDKATWIFDVNGLWMPLGDWERDIVPRLIEAIPRADGNWYRTHSWEVRRS